MNLLLDLAEGTVQDPPPAALVFPPSVDLPTRSLPALRLTGVLQTTLEPEQILRLFSAELSHLVPHDGLAFFFSSAPGAHLMLGRHARHSASYRLTVHNQLLGTLLVYRDRHFTAAEVESLEDLLTGLVYPLRNALLYQAALAAALQDPLTGVGNRAALDLALEREVSLAQRNVTPLSLLILDLDRFKRVNDHYGHATGDCVLRALAHRVTACVRSTDVVARFGGEELAVVLNNTAAAGACHLAERIRAAVEATQVRCGSHLVQVTVSIGVADLQPAEDSRGLFTRADAALYQAKEAGRNRIQCAMGGAKTGKDS
jgi:diguanylate cyclase